MNTLSQKPISVWNALRANFYWRFRRNKLVLVDTATCAVVRMPGGAMFAAPMPRQMASSRDAIPMPSPANMLFHGPREDLIGSFRSFGADNMPAECSPADDDVADCTREKPHDGPCNGWKTPDCHSVAPSEERSLPNLAEALDVALAADDDGKNS